VDRRIVSPGSVSAVGRPRLSERRVELFWGILFHLPAFVFFAVFLALPIAWGLGLAFYEWDVFHDAAFVGSDNFRRFFADPVARQVVTSSVVYSLEVVPLSVLLSLFFAVLLNARLRGITVFRWLYFLPLVTSAVATALVWLWIFSGNYGLINIVFGFLLPQPRDWLLDGQTVLHAISFMSIWRSLPVNIILFLAALQEVSPDLYEAADIDGADHVARFRFVTWPGVTPTTFLVLTLQIIQSFFSAFDLVAVLTQGGPVNASNVIVYFIYEQAFRFFQFGYASAIALLLFVAVLLITLAQWRLQKYWVHY